MPGNADIKSSEDAFRLLSERLKAQSVRPNIYGYVPHPKQAVFHDSLSRRKLFLGGNRSGKTVSGIVEDIWWLTGKHPRRKTPEPPIRGRIVSVDFLNGVEKIIIPELSRWIPPSALRQGSWEKSYNRANRILTFDNGSTVDLMSYDQDLAKFAGTSRHFTHFDEEPPEDIYKECLARLVDTGGSWWMTMTPVDGMSWTQDELYDPGLSSPDRGILVTQVEMTENPFLNPVEIEQFISNLTPDEVEARVKGRYVALGGLVFKSFNRDIHVSEPFVPPKDWLWIASLDHGYTNPSAWLWHAVSNEGRIVTFREYYQSEQTIDTIAARYHEICKELGRYPDFNVGDPSIKAVNPITATSVLQEYIKYGIPIVLGNNDVSAGILRMNRYLKKDSNEVPYWSITANCSNLIWEMQRYRWKLFSNSRAASKNNLHEQPQKKNDHACDSARYFFMSSPEFSGMLIQENVSGPNGPSGMIEASRVASDYDESLRANRPQMSDSNKEWNRLQNGAWAIDEYLGAEW